MDQTATEAMWDNTRIRVIRADITASAAEVIVNAANSSLLGGGGVDGAIHRAAGPDLLAACREVVAAQGGCETGSAVITRAGNLQASYVVHTVGPVWTGAQPGVHDALLAQCYSQSLRLAHEAGARTIAFPNISTGVYRFPRQRAATVAISAVRTWLGKHQDSLSRIDFVCFEQENVEHYDRILSIE